MSKTVFVVSKQPLGINYPPYPLDSYIDERELIKETPKGLRLSINYGKYGTIFLHDRYEFFDSHREALLYLEAEAKRVLADLQEKASQFQVFVGALSHEILKDAASINDKPPVSLSITAADSEALAAMPDSGWFTLTDSWSSSINRPQYRLDRLVAAGCLEWRGSGEYPRRVIEYRKTEGGAA